MKGILAGIYYSSEFESSRFTVPLKTIKGAMLPGWHIASLHLAFLFFPVPCGLDNYQISAMVHCVVMFFIG